MKRSSYTIDINATPERVYDVMLGLSDKKTYEDWAAEFNPTSTWEGSWNTGDKILFVGTSETGEKAGMVAYIAENDPAKFVSIRHFGVLENGEEIIEGPKVEGWQNALEDYRFEPTATGTRLTASIDTVEEYASYFDETWPKALAQLKAICEQ